MHDLILFWHGVSGGNWNGINTKNTWPKTECRWSVSIRGTNILEQVIMLVMERVGEKSTPPEYAFVQTPETDLSLQEFEQLPLTPNMSPHHKVLKDNL